MWLPDTKAWIALINARPSPVKTKFQSHTPDPIYLCDVAKTDLSYGAFRSARRDDNLALLYRLFPAFPSLAFDAAAARKFGEIRAASTAFPGSAAAEN